LLKFEDRGPVDEGADREQHVLNTICMGARDRETALNWIMDASANGDWDYLLLGPGLALSLF
jgi:hypothetical protein